MSNPNDMGEKRQVSILGPTLKFKGDLTANEDLVIQGQIEGKVKHTSNLTVGKQGKVKANLNAENITVEGTVDGDLKGRKTVVVKATANVTGNIVSPTVTLHEGSTFNGGIEMTSNSKASAQPGGSKSAAPKAERKQPDHGQASNDSDSAAGSESQSAGAA